MDHIDSPDSGRTETNTKVPNESSQTTTHQTSSQSISSSPDDLAPFDWEEFEARYKKALEEADDRELEILKEFGTMTQYFNVWAKASSTHDDERAIKRLYTRQRFVAQSEESMARKQQHCEYLLVVSSSSCFKVPSPPLTHVPDDNVMEAFKNALRLLKDH